MNTDAIKTMIKGFEESKASYETRAKEAIKNIGESANRSIESFWVQQSIEHAHAMTKRVTMTATVIEKLKKLEMLIGTNTKADVTLDQLFDALARLEPRPNGTPDYFYAFRTIMHLTNGE